MAVGLRSLVALGIVLASLPAVARAQPPDCEPGAVKRAADFGRDNIVAAVGADEARLAWKQVLDCGGVIAWPATLYNVDARSTFVLTFDRQRIRVHRAKAAEPEAAIPWSNVREIEAGNWVIWFRLFAPVAITSDRGTQKHVKELKVFLHGGDGGDLTYYYNLEYVGRHWFWGTPLYEVKNLRGIAVGPTEYQRRVQGFLAETFDPDHRIVLKRKGRGAGW